MGKIKPFRSPLRRQGRRRRWQPAIRIGLMFGVLLGVWWFVKPYAEAEWQEVGQSFGTCGERGRPYACVSDGDTVTIGYGAGARRIRLRGFDALEVDGACAAERARASEAEQALRVWLGRGTFEWDGGASPPRDQYGRELRRARRKLADGSYEDLAQYMIDAGLAEGEAFWEQRDWCG